MKEIRQNQQNEQNVGSSPHSVNSVHSVQSAPLSAEIEGFLFAEHRWVAARELCQRFGLGDERALRACGERPGLVSDFAISGDKGFKHIAHATPGEWDRFSERLRQHGIAELVRVKKLREARQRLTRETPPVVIEKTTGQCLLNVA